MPVAQSGLAGNGCFGGVELDIYVRLEDDELAEED